MAASVDITMPQLGETVTEGTITRWFKAVGDPISEDEPLFEVSTDKVDSEVPSSASGFVSEILVPEGETVDVGVRLAVITATANQAPVSPAAPSQPAPKPDREPEPIETPAVPDPVAVVSTPASPNSASAERPATNPDPSDAHAKLGGYSLSPVVRRLMGEHGLTPGDVDGTGVDGRITRADVMQLVKRRGSDGSRGSAAPADRSKATPASPEAPIGGAATQTAPIEAPAPARRTTGDTVVPFSNIRRRTAEHMVRSLATAAHVLVVTEVDFDNVDRVRLAARERFKAEEGFSLTYLPFVVRATIDAIADFPHVNASVGNEELIVHGSVHLGFAVDLSFDGLIVPVIHDADTKRMRAMARELADLAARARTRKVNADEIAGSTFTITNPGSFGTFITAPIINQPQVAIVSTDGVRKKPVVVTLGDGSDAIAIHPVGMLAMSFDHRAFDGAYAAAFLARCREILETRDWAQEL